MRFSRTLAISSRTGSATLLALVVSAAAGCNSGGSLQLTPSGQSAVSSASGLQSIFYPSAARDASVVADNEPAFMLPEARLTDLVYITDIKTNTVSVYTFPHGKRVGKLKGFHAPEGACSDVKTGNVFIVDQFKSRILEFAHGATTESHVFTDPDQFPVGCSFDPATGDLAVSNIRSTKGGAGSVVIYAANENGKGNKINDSAIKAIYFCGYDRAGDLFIDGTAGTAGGQFEFAELPKNGKKFMAITLTQSIGAPGAVQWDGRHVAVMDTTTSTIYRYKIKGSAGTLVATTQIPGSGQGQFWIVTTRNDRRSHKIVMPDSANKNVGFYTYPGAAQLKLLRRFKSPVGSTVSLKP